MNTVTVTITNIKGEKLASFKVSGDGVVAGTELATLIREALSHWFNIKRRAA